MVRLTKAQVLVQGQPCAEWCWVLQMDARCINYPLLIQRADSSRYWVGINEISAAKLNGVEVSTRKLWDELLLPEPSIGRHFFTTE